MVDEGTNGGGGTKATGGALNGGSPAASAGAPPNGGSDNAGGQQAEGGADTNGGMNNEAGAMSGGSGGMDVQLPQKVLFYDNGAIDSVAQMDIIEDKLTEWGFESERTSDPAKLTGTELEQYGAVLMMNPCFDAFGADGEPQAAALQAYVEAGGNIWGNHCASVTYQSANPPHPWNQLLGGRGGDGFWEGANSCRTLSDHPTAAALPAEFDYDGNLDNTNYLADDITILVRCTWGGNGNRDVVVSWTREVGLGRIFFTNFAKFENDFANATLRDGHLFPGLAWVLRQ
jgi:hypothetical protein